MESYKSLFIDLANKAVKSIYGKSFEEALEKKALDSLPAQFQDPKDGDEHDTTFTLFQLVKPFSKFAKFTNFKQFSDEFSSGIATFVQKYNSENPQDIIEKVEAVGGFLNIWFHAGL